MASAALAIVDQVGPALSLELPRGQSFEEWTETGRQLAAGSKALNWWIGDWWAAGTHRYGERAKVAAEGLFGREFQSLMDMAMVCRAFEASRRREVLSFSHHREVAGLPPAKADALLDRAETENWSTRDLRAEVIIARDRHVPRWFEAKPPTRYDREVAKEAVYQRLDRAAQGGETCPTADELAEVAGVESVSTTVALMHLLEDEKRIEVTRYQRGRTVRIVATGRSTAEPNDRTPHWREIPGRLPTVAVQTFVQRHPDKAQAIYASAKSEGKSPQEYLDECVVLGLEVKEVMADSVARVSGLRADE